MLSVVPDKAHVPASCKARAAAVRLSLPQCVCIVIDAVLAAVVITTIALTMVTATGTTIFETISAMVRKDDLHMCREGLCGIPLIGLGNRASHNKRRHCRIFYQTPSGAYL